MFRSLRLLIVETGLHRVPLFLIRLLRKRKGAKPGRGKVKFWYKTLNPLERMGRLKSCEEKADINDYY